MLSVSKFRHIKVYLFKLRLQSPVILVEIIGGAM